ncbi:MAG: zf-HC2 domain-containing protein [Candidatus Hatepunaea meridiana]|nr:zf-HC2 domain-containing protein [Candidatus Hatepunaea meridiana]
MITCDRFEDNYEAYQSGKLPPEQEDLLRRHVAECEHCQIFAQSTYRLRVITASLPRVEPSPNFRFQLDKKIRMLSGARSGKIHSNRSVIPRWAALGAGLATGLAVGLIILLTPESTDFAELDTSPSNIEVVKQEQLASELTDSTDAADDSLEVPEQSYNPDKYSQVVSTEK